MVCIGTGLLSLLAKKMLFMIPGDSLWMAVRQSCSNFMLIISNLFNISSNMISHPFYVRSDSNRKGNISYISFIIFWRLLYLNMGKQSSKIKDILFVTGSDLDPEEFKTQKIYNPTKDPKINYRTFTPKKHYKPDATDQEIAEHLQKVKKKEDILKNFKCYKDFDRINFKEMKLNVAPFEVYVEQAAKWSLICGFMAARLIQVQLYGDYYTTSGIFRLFIPCFCTLLPLILQNALTSTEYHIVNHEYFRLVDNQIALYQQFDLQLNLYKDVEDMKYNFKYPTVPQFYKMKRQIMDRLVSTLKAPRKQYFMYKNQLKFDPYEEFIKERQKQRKQSKDLITPSEKEQILANLESKQKVI